MFLVSFIFDNYERIQGKTLETPEKVPFRLTQNLIDGLGISGVEGQWMDLLYSKQFATSP